MNLRFLFPMLTLSLGLACPGLAAIRYVDLNNPQPAPPYTNWASAAQTIQDAVNAADAGDQVLVTNGVYQTGGMVYNGMSNRVAVTKPLLLSSVNGPDVTLIQGVQVPDTITGTGAVRCVYLVDGALLAGFTLSNGATLATASLGINSGAGVFGDSTNAAVTNCVIINNVAYGSGGGATQVSLYNCTISNNALGPLGLVGGGVMDCFASHCTIAGNSAVSGGGACESILIGCSVNNNLASLDSGAGSDCALLNCSLTNNLASQEAGATSGCGLTNCLVIGNYAPKGGGLWGTNMAVNCLIALNRATSATGGGADHTATLINCLVLSNYAAQSGGGAGDHCVLNNCILAGNSSPVGAGAANVSLNNCTLTNNSGDYGGGVADCSATNCTLAGNSATVSGGGAYGGSLVNCLLMGNDSADTGGGAANDPYTPLTLVNCTLAANWATNTCGGVDGGIVNNSIVYSNSAPSEANYSPYDSYLSTGTILNYSCTTPAPNAGTGDITGPPLFVDESAGNFRLQTNSPCVNAGNNAYVVASTDLDGRPRISQGAVDMGAYEFQGPGIGEFTAWLQQYSLPTDGSADYTDPDGDGMNNWQEWIADTNPTNALSALRILSITNSPSGAAVTWLSADTRQYFLQSAPVVPRSGAFTTVATNVVGHAGATTYVDTTASATGPRFYRVGVHQ